MLTCAQEIALLRSVNEELLARNNEIALACGLVCSVYADVCLRMLTYADVGSGDADAPSDTVRGLSERMLELKKMLLLNTKNHAQVLYVSLYYICVLVLLGVLVLL